MESEDKQFNVAIVGATGAVGETMVKVLEERNFPVDQLYLLASSRSAGKRLEFRGGWLKVTDLTDFDFSQVQIALFSAGGSVSAEYAPQAAAAGAVVIDNTSHFRRDDDIPLVVPEVNPQAIAGYKTRGIIANPNCSTIQMLVALKPIYDAVGITRINVCTYQAVSGTGQSAIEELAGQTAALLSAKPIESEVYPKQIAFNVLPHIDSFEENGYTREEMKMVWETHKIFDDDSIGVNPTAVRVPVFFGHSEAIHIETRAPISAARATQLLEQASGVEVIDRHEDGGYPTAVTEAADSDLVYVGRIRNDPANELGLNLWVVADNVRKGAATNSVQIAEELIKNYF
ncbi:MAG: aspartate-semialdehyde dehydrogenase [Immundisolibacteraceae bacterium]|nr:aspartate-semialdehyde dehydrogenase [Immundisolibacteraceae bacterium]